MARRMNQEQALNLLREDGLSALAQIEENCPGHWRSDNFVIAAISILCDELLLPWEWVVVQLKRYVHEDVWNRISRRD